MEILEGVFLKRCLSKRCHHVTASQLIFTADVHSEDAEYGQTSGTYSFHNRSFARNREGDSSQMRKGELPRFQAPKQFVLNSWIFYLSISPIVSLEGWGQYRRGSQINHRRPETARDNLLRGGRHRKSEFSNFNLSNFDLRGCESSSCDTVSGGIQGTVFGSERVFSATLLDSRPGAELCQLNWTSEMRPA